jgi:hypothetical protein
MSTHSIARGQSAAASFQWARKALAAAHWDCLRAAHEADACGEDGHEWWTRLEDLSRAGDALNLPLLQPFAIHHVTPSGQETTGQRFYRTLDEAREDVPRVLAREWPAGGYVLLNVTRCADPRLLSWP